MKACSQFDIDSVQQLIFVHCVLKNNTHANQGDAQSAVAVASQLVEIFSEGGIIYKKVLMLY